MYSGGDASKDVEAQRVPATPWFLNAMQQRLFPPVFSHTFDSGDEIGQKFGTLAFGGISDVAHENSWASTPMLKGSSDDLCEPLIYYSGR
jgi:hypothetical protein